MSEWHHVQREDYDDDDYFCICSDGRHAEGHELSLLHLNRLEALAELARRAVPMVEVADSWAASENLHDLRDRCDDWLRDHKTLTEQ